MTCLRSKRLEALAALVLAITSIYSFYVYGQYEMLVPVLSLLAIGFGFDALDAPGRWYMVAVISISLGIMSCLSQVARYLEYLHPVRLG